MKRVSLHSLLFYILMVDASILIDAGVYRFVKYAMEHHWHCAFKFCASDWFGFVYVIFDQKTSKRYIGKKQFWTTIRKPPLAGKVRKRTITKESDWRFYQSSCLPLITAIGQRPADFQYKIESLHSTKSALSYREVELQMDLRVMRHPDMFYNAAVGSSLIRYRPTGSSKYA